jgi:EAL domain-containing protein (putative c-di-GMP-specific phosphodiesterase class I)
MSRHTIPAVITLAVFPVAAVGLSIYMLASGNANVTAVAGAVLLLGTGLFAIGIVGVQKFSSQEEWLLQQQDVMGDTLHRLDSLTARIDGVEQSVDQPMERLDEIKAELKGLRDNLRSLIQAKEKPEAPAQAANAPPPAEASAETPATSPAPKPQSAGEHLELLLEPVIELATGSTAHYRALLNLTDDHGHSVRHADLMQKADEGGMRPALDAHMVKLVAPVLRRLRAKNPTFRAFVPLGIATLGSREETSRIVANLERDVDIAGGVVFEFNHRDLGALDDDGIQNLARLGRLGATMALAQVQVAGLDLAALRQLGVRYLTFPPNAADAGFGPTPAWREFVQYARAMQFQIIVSDITAPQQATAATQVGRFGYGPFFAPPRKVRADAGLAAAASRRASAA